MSFEKMHWLKLALNLRGSVIPAVQQQVFLSMIFALFITLIYERGFHAFHQPALAGLIPGIVLGLLLVFRTNTANDRFWEGWKLTGRLAVECRNLGRQLLVNIPEKTPEDTQEKMAYIRLVYGYYYAAILHLRKDSVDDTLREIVSPQQYAELKTAIHKPLKIATWFGQYVNNLYERNYIDTIRLSEFNQLLNQMVQCVGGCERILIAPLPKAYVLHLRHLLILYCLAVPFQLVKDLHWWTIPTVGIITFALFGVEAIGVEIENPFGHDANDIVMEKFFNAVKANIEMLVESHSTQYSIEELPILQSIREQ